jgi:hypothetical protein
LRLPSRPASLGRSARGVARRRLSPFECQRVIQGQHFLDFPGDEQAAGGADFEQVLAVFLQQGDDLRLQVGRLRARFKTPNLRQLATELREE